MRKTLCLLLFSLILIFLGCGGNTGRHTGEPFDLTIMTEEYAPLNFTVDGELTGQTTEVVRELMRRTGTSATI